MNLETVTDLRRRLANTQALELAKVILSRFHLNDHILRFHPQIQMQNQFC